MSDSLQLLGFDCPFVEHTLLLLSLKNGPFEYLDICNCNPRPQWFIELKPRGKVPVLLHQGKAIYDSANINEYLENIYPSTPALPANALDLALCRTLIDYCGKDFASTRFALLTKQDADEADKLMADVLASWRWLNELLLQHNPGGSFAFSEFGMADITYTPFLSRCAALPYYRHFELPEAAEFTRLRCWYQACMAHPLIAKIAMPQVHVIKLYYRHSQGWETGRLPSEGEQNSLDPEIPYELHPMPPRPSGEYWQSANL